MIRKEFYILRNHRQEMPRNIGRERSAPPRSLPEVYFFATPSVSSAWLATLTASSCFACLWSPSASLSLASAPLTFASFAFIFAAASRPCLISFGHWNACAAPALSTSAATAITTVSFFIPSPPRGAYPLPSPQQPAAVSGSTEAGWKWAKIRCASLGVTLGTAASSATEDSRTRRAEPSVLSRLVRIVRPTPALPSTSHL